MGDYAVAKELQDCDTGGRRGHNGRQSLSFAVPSLSRGRFVSPVSTASTTPAPPISRRAFLKTSAKGALAAGCVFSLGDAMSLHVTHKTLHLTGLPRSLSGFKVAFASDFHHGPLVDLPTIREAVDRINAQSPDVILLGGDYITLGIEYYEGVFEELSRLAAPRGVYSVPGNHEYGNGIVHYRKYLSATPIADLTNKGFAVDSGLYIAGLDDEWGGSPDAVAAVADAPSGVPRVVFTHNPALADLLPAGFAGLIIAGHTHGWQVYVPGVTRFAMPIDSMRKYRAGYYRTAAGLMYVSRGVGLYHIPLRLWASAEVTMFTLKSA